jgi:cysteine desulfurase / selenocysteine lyase
MFMRTEVDQTSSAAAMPIGIPEARQLFPGARDSVYLSVCDRAILADTTVAAVARFVAAMQGAQGVKADHESVVASSRRRFAELINATPQEIALVSNVSDGVNTIGWALPWKPGDNVVLTAALEHPNNLYPWLRLRSKGLEIRDVAPKDGRIDPEAMVAAIDGRTRVVSCASVTFSPGLRTDLVPIGQACRARGVFFLVDAVQSVGILRHDVEAEYIDGLTTSTSKGLLGLYGCGFLYCRREWADRLEPAYLSRTGADVPQDKPSEMGTYDYAFQAGAWRFEVGSHNFAGAYAADASLAMLLALGPVAIEDHVLRLSHRLANGLLDLGLPVSGGRPGPHTAHIITVGRLGDGGHSVTSDAALQAWSDRLRTHGVVHTIRRGQVRFALHCFNDDSDVDRVLEWTRQHLQASSARPEQPA